MRNQRLVLIALLALLLVGGAAVGWFFVFGSDPSPRQNQAAQTNSDDEPGKAHGSSKDGPIDRPAATNQPVDGPGPAPTPTPKVNNNPDPVKVPVTPKPDTPGQEGPDTKDWPVRTTEHTIKGTIIYKSDGRPASGAAITAEFNDAGQMWGGEAVKTRPVDVAAKLEGSTTSDGAGEFTLVVKLSRKVPPEVHRETEGDERPPAKDISPEDEEEDRRAGRAWQNWGYVENIVVVGRMAGYAPARSGAIWLNQTEVPPVKLALAIPAALSGRVIDAVSRTGIAGATVTVYQADAGNAGWTAPRNAQSDKDGYFAISDLGAGTYMYAAQAEGYTTESAMQTGRRVDLTKGGETDLGEIPLLPAGSVTGVVVDAQTGKPLAGATVELEQGNQWGRWSQNQGVSDAEGRFTIKSVGAGSYTLKATAAEYAMTSQPDVVVEAGKLVDVGQVRMGRGFAFTGTVVDASGTGVAGAVVTIAERGRSSGFGWEGEGRQLGTATTGSNGSFTISGMSECSARVTVTAEGFAQTRVEVELKPAMPAVVLTLLRGLTITGRVLGVDGTPAKEITVGVISHTDPAYQVQKAQPEQMRWFGQAGIQTVTLEDGRFKLANVPPGTYLLLALPASGRGASMDNLKIAGETDLDVGDLRLPAPGSVRVTVTEQGQPVAGLKVELRTGFGGWGGGSDSTVPAGETDATGVVVINDVPAGDAYVRTGRDKDDMDIEIFTKRRIAVKSGQVTEFKLELKPADACRLYGRVTLNGKPQFNEAILLGTGDKASYFKQAKVDEAGFYEFSNVPFGAFVLHLRVADKMITSAASVTVEKGGELEVNRDFAGNAVSGTVNTPKNTPAERAAVKVSMVRLNDGSPDAFVQWLKAETTCNADGRFRLDHAPAGNYRLTASLEGVGSATQDVTVSGSDVTGVTLELANNSGRLRVTVKKVNGTPIAQQNFGLVQLRDAAGSILTFEDQNTGFLMVAAGSETEIPTVPAGTYTVVLTSAGCLPFEKAAVTVTTGSRTDVEVDLTAAAELHLTVTNSEVTQEHLDAALVKYYDAQGVEIPKVVSPFDAWSGSAAAESATLRVRNIGPTVAQVKIKIQGFAELAVAVEFEAGKKIEKQETLVAG